MFNGILEFIFVFVIVWWMVLFMVLPFFVERDENPQSGNDHGAPKNPRLKQKFLATTIFAIVLTIIYFQFSESFWGYFAK